MYTKEINGKLCEFNFGLGFVREIDKSVLIEGDDKRKWDRDEEKLSRAARKRRGVSRQRTALGQRQDLLCAEGHADPDPECEKQIHTRLMTGGRCELM